MLRLLSLWNRHYKWSYNSDQIILTGTSSIKSLNQAIQESILNSVALELVVFLFLVLIILRYFFNGIVDFVILQSEPNYFDEYICMQQINYTQSGNVFLNNYYFDDGLTHFISLENYSSWQNDYLSSDIRAKPAILISIISLSRSLSRGKFMRLLFFSYK